MKERRGVLPTAPCAAANPRLTYKSTPHCPRCAGKWRPDQAAEAEEWREHGAFAHEICEGVCEPFRTNGEGLPILPAEEP